MESTARVMVVEDDPLLAQLVTKYLERDHYQVTHCADGTSAVATARDLDPDVIILDLGLPGIDGLEVCRQVRQFSDCYIVMLTARDDEVDTLVGLSVGADDYLTKPFSHRELLARVKVLLRRPRLSATPPPDVAGPPSPGDLTSGAPGPGAEPVSLVFGDLRITPAAREVHVAQEVVELTPTEFDLLVALAEHEKVVLSRRQLIEAVWGPAWVGDERMIDVHVRNLRRKLGDDATAPRYVRTVRGAGYRIGTGR